MSDYIPSNLKEVESRILSACIRSGRRRDEITLVGVSKTFPAAAVDVSIRAGLLHIGENRVQEFRDKLPLIAGKARWHLIGHLQSNKARDAVRLFDVIHSVDRLELAQKLSVEAERSDRKIEVLIQVNVGGEPQKHGVAALDVAELAWEIEQLPGLKLSGLMTIPPVGSHDETRLHFQELRRVRDEIGKDLETGTFTHLSMGMSDDFEIAIEEGATMVRLGRLLFGERDQ